MMKLCVKSPGAGGELMQGTLNGQPFLVTCPIDLYSYASLSAKEALPNDSKAYAAQKITLAYLGERYLPHGIALRSELPRGKGLASSSADIAAVCQLTALAFGKRLAEREIAAIAAQIEPTDVVFCEGFVMCNHLTGAVQRVWKKAPRLSIALFDLGGSVDTLSFNMRQDLHRLNLHKERTVKEALSLLDQGMRQNEPSLIGRAATLSAFAHQEILPKVHLPEIYDIAMEHRAVGINIAHSGTVVGMMFTPVEAPFIEKARQHMQVKYPEIKFLTTVQLISGGLRIEEIEDEQSI